jgi:hypothetical protein
MMTPEILERDLAGMKPLVHFKVLQMVGGEPTLNKNLVALINVARASGIADAISVITNGSLLPKMADDFWQAIDWLQLSIYPKLDPSIPALAKAKCEQFGRPFYSTTFTHFYKQFREVHNDGAHFETCHWRSSCWQIHAGHFALCPQSLFFPKTYLGLAEFTDALCIEGITEDSLAGFINRKEPLASCKMCMANELKSYPWREAKNREEWQKEEVNL